MGDRRVEICVTNMEQRSTNEARIHNTSTAPIFHRNLCKELGGQDSYSSLKEKITNIDKTGPRGSSLIDMGLDQIEALPRKPR
jgi:hypothetical protein